MRRDQDLPLTTGGQLKNSPSEQHARRYVEAAPRRVLMLITDYVLSKKVSARDLFGERLKKFGIQEHVASGKDDERSRCLTDGSQCLAVFLTEDGFVDFLTAYGADAPRKILHAICEAFGAKIFSEHEPQFWDLWKAATAERSRNMPT